MLRLLGPSWDVVYSDWQEDAGGNRERAAFLFDRRAVTFNGLAAEVDAPRQKKGEEFLPGRSFWRAPYMCSFRAGNFDFIAIAMHARWGKGTSGREGELQLLADWIDLRFKSKYVEDHDLLVMGDFNVPKLGDKLFKALTSRGLQIPTALQRLKVGDRMVDGSNLDENARYDQILHLPSSPGRFSNYAGTVDFYAKGAMVKKLFPGSGYTKIKFSLWCRWTGFQCWRHGRCRQLG